MRKKSWMGSGSNPKSLENIQICQEDGSLKPVTSAEKGNVRAVSWSGYHWLKTKHHSCDHCILNENDCASFELGSSCKVIDDYIDQRMKAFIFEQDNEGNLVARQGINQDMGVEKNFRHDKGLPVSTWHPGIGPAPDPLTQSIRRANVARQA